MSREEGHEKEEEQGGRGAGRVLGAAGAASQAVAPRGERPSTAGEGGGLGRSGTRPARRARRQQYCIEPGAWRHNRAQAQHHGRRAPPHRRCLVPGLLSPVKAEVTGPVKNPPFFFFVPPGLKPRCGQAGWARRDTTKLGGAMWRGCDAVA